MVEGAKAGSHFQKAVLKIGDYLIVLAVALVALILITALFRHESMFTILRFALLLTVVAIGKKIARQIGLGTNILNAQVFGYTKHHETGKLAESIEKADGFAQVFPEHKYHTVEVLQQRGHIIGMTGDGVNDAPARPTFSKKTP